MGDGKSSRVPKGEFKGGRMRCRGKCMQVRRRERVQRGWLSLTISTFNFSPVLPSESAREPRVITPPLHVPNYTVLGVSLTWSRAEQSKRLII
jgi:hypothetical protein